MNNNEGTNQCCPLVLVRTATMINFLAHLLHWTCVIVIQHCYCSSQTLASECPQTRRTLPLKLSTTESLIRHERRAAGTCGSVNVRKPAGTHHFLTLQRLDVIVEVVLQDEAGLAHLWAQLEPETHETLNSRTIMRIYVRRQNRRTSPWHHLMSSWTPPSSPRQCHFHPGWRSFPPQTFPPAPPRRPLCCPNIHLRHSRRTSSRLLHRPLLPPLPPLHWT